MVTASPPRVLIVEDETIVRAIMVIWLAEEGFDVLEAADAAQALAILNEPDHISVLFTDVRMPGQLDGIDLAFAARKGNPNLPIVLTSGFANKLHERLHELGQPHRFVSKPYAAEGVVQIIREMVRAAPLVGTGLLSV